jgi:hypothetical protein
MVIFFGGYPAEAGLVGLPVRPVGAGHEVETNDRDGQGVDDALPVLRQIERGEEQAAQFVDRPLQGAAAAIEAGARGLVREQVAVLLPAADGFGFLVPAAAFADQGHRHQFGIGADWCRPRSPALGRDLPPHLVDNAVRPQAEILERPRAGTFALRYHDGGPPSGEAVPSTALLPDRGPLRNSHQLAHWLTNKKEYRRNSRFPCRGARSRHQGHVDDVFPTGSAPGYLPLDMLEEDTDLERTLIRRTQ